MSIGYVGEVEKEFFSFSNLLQVLSGHGPCITPGKDETGLGDKIFQASSLCLRGSQSQHQSCVLFYFYHPFRP